MTTVTSRNGTYDVLEDDRPRADEAHGSTVAGLADVSRTRDSRVAVIGLGYTGLPLAISFAEAGLEVQGIDSFAGRVAELNARSSPIDDISNDRLAAAFDLGMTVVAPDASALSDADAIFVCVLTPITPTKDPDLTPVLTAAAYIKNHLRAGQLVILQSTTFPGTTTGTFREILELSGLVAGEDFDLAYAPERVNPGDPESASKGVPRLVGATTPAGTTRAAALLAHINDQVVEMSSPDAAELSKLLENVFRNINIAFVNQLALLCERMGLDVWEVIGGAATKPFGFMKFTPGPGVGGHCIPVDPYYLSWRAREFDFIDRFIETAADINLAMPRHVVTLVAEALNARNLSMNGAKVGVIGVAFKADIQDARNSPAADVIAGIDARGGDVRYHDPHVATFKDGNGSVRSSTGLDDLLAWADVIVVVTAHRSIDWDHVYGRADLVVDTVNSSSGHRTRPGQVLRLGAGWGSGV
jgi:UDP-N-acetyl-D-glucosamine dehydrogenase